MKRFAMVFVLALLALTSVFSATLDSAELNVTMELTEDKLSSYAVGFTSDITDESWKADHIDMTKVPESVKDNNINLVYNPLTATASNAPAYLFYKARSAKSITLSLVANSALQCEGKNDVNFTVTVGSDSNNKVDTRNLATGWSETIKPGNDNFVAGTFPINIVTDPINADAAGVYSTSLKLEVKSV